MTAMRTSWRAQWTWSKSRSRGPPCGSNPPLPPPHDSDSDSDGANAWRLEALRPLPGGGGCWVRGRHRRVHPEKVKSRCQLIPDRLPLLKLCPGGLGQRGPGGLWQSPRWGPPGPDPPWKQQLRSKAVSLSQDTSPLPWPLPRTKSRKHTGALHPEGQGGEHAPPAPSSPKQRQGPAA